MIERAVVEHAEVMRVLGERCGPAIEKAGGLIVAALRVGRRLLLCGNGGSAADAEQYFTEADVTKVRAVGYRRAFTGLEDGIAEYVERYLKPDRVA